MSIDSWDDLRFVLAASRAGTLTAAAQRLGVDQSTVTRRLRAIEEKSHGRLFERLRGGVELTPLGEVIAQGAADVEKRLLALEVETRGREGQVSGRVRVTSTELLTLPLIEGLVQLGRENEGLEIELVGHDAPLSLSRAEADVAIRVTRNPPDHLVGRKICKVGAALYAHERFEDTPIEEIPWIGWSSNWPGETQTDLMRARLSHAAPIAMRVNSYALLIEALEQGAGLALMPCILAEKRPNWRRFSEVEQRTWQLWVMTHPDLRRSPRIRVVVDYLVEALKARKAELQGSEA